MSAQQVKALFDTNVMVLGHIVQRISETWRVNEAEQLQTLLDQLVEFVRAGDIEKFTIRFLNIWLNSMRWWPIPI